MSDDTPLEDAIELSEQMTLEIRKIRSEIEDLKDDLDDDDDGPDPETGTDATVAPVG